MAPGRTASHVVAGAQPTGPGGTPELRGTAQPHHAAQARQRSQRGFCFAVRRERDCRRSDGVPVLVPELRGAGHIGGGTERFRRRRLTDHGGEYSANSGRIAKTGRCSHSEVARTCALMGRRQEALDRLQTAVESREMDIVALNNDPLAGLRESRGFKTCRKSLDACCEAEARAAGHRCLPISPTYSAWLPQ